MLKNMVIFILSYILLCSNTSLSDLIICWWSSSYTCSITSWIFSSIYSNKPFTVLTFLFLLIWLAKLLILKFALYKLLIDFSFMEEWIMGYGTCIVLFTRPLYRVWSEVHCRGLVNLGLVTPYPRLASVFHRITENITKCIITEI